MYSKRPHLLSHAITWCLVAGMIVSWSVSSDAQCVKFFDDETQFLASLPSPSLESFEGLTATDSYTTNQFVLSGFTIDVTNPGIAFAGVWSGPDGFGRIPTDGDNHIVISVGTTDTTTFSFNSPKNAFGLNITDWGDFSNGSLVFMNDAGDEYTIAVTPTPNGVINFFGVINYDFDFTMAMFIHNGQTEAYGIDEVYCDYINLPNSDAIACKNVNISLNENCEALVVPATVLSGFYPCFDDYVVELSYHNKPVPNPITLDHLGHTITATVTDTTTGNSCWSSIYVEDKFPPEVICEDDTVNCIVYNMHYDTPSVIEHCLTYELNKIDERIESLSCDERFIKRVTQTFLATDEYGNVSDTCSRSIMIERFPLERTQCPVREKTLYCSDNYRTDNNGHPHPDITGTPYIYNPDLSKATLYGADNEGNYFTIDIDHGTAHLVSEDFNDPAMLPCPPLDILGRSSNGVTEIEFDPQTGYTFAKSVDGCDYGFTFDPRSGCEDVLVRTIAPPDFIFGDFQGAEVIDGIWYVSSVSRERLETFDPVTGMFSPIGPHGGNLSFSGLAYDGTTLYGCESRGGTGLYSIDTNTGIASFIGSTGVSLGSIEFGPDGRLYGGGGRPPYQGRIYSIDPSTAQVRQVATTGLNTTVTSLVLIYEALSLYPQPDFFCNLWVDYTDVDFGKVGCTRKIQRTWSVQEWWCTEDLERRCTQIIYIKDTVGPEVYFPVDSIYATTNPGYHNCDGDVYIPWPFADDACHNPVELDLKFPGGFVDKWQGEKIKLPVGFHTVYVTAYDSCYNANSDSIIVHVQDKVAPIAVCDQNTVIALDNDGIVHAYADIFDDGSFDDCEIKKIEVRRMDDPCMSGTDEWGDYVEFCCADVNTEVMVAFRVADKSGNYGNCMVRVLVQDKLPPRVICPPDITVDCRFDYDPNNLDVFGSMAHADSLRESIVIDSDTVRFDGPAIDGLAYDNCPMVMVDSSYFESFDQCGNGRLYRDFYAVDAQGQRSFVCTQHIDFVNSRPFTGADIIWPQDFDTVNVCSPFPFDPDLLSEERGYPRFRGEDECSLIGATYKDHIIDNTGGAFGCFKILRKWKVIDWCQRYNNEFLKWEHEQVILVENDRAPTILTRSCQDTVICFYTPNCTPPEITLSIATIDDCTPRDRLYIEAKIDLDNDGSFDTIRLDGNSVTGLFPAGIHRIKWLVEDLCGNETTCEYLFELRNCKAPLAYCRTGAILELTPMDLDGDGIPDAEMAELWASDLDDGSTAECNKGVVFSFSADTADKVRMYDCDSIGNRAVTIYVTDRVTGVSSRCRTMVTIQDNNNVNVCPQTLTGTISGFVTTPSDDSVMEVVVELDGAGMPDDMTQDDGQYAFKDMPLGGDYLLKPRKNDDMLNGVSTADIVKLQRYLLGKSPLTGPYEYIAADVNLSGTLTAADISELRKVILGRANEFSGSKSWRFIEKNFQFNDPDHPLDEQFPESRFFAPFEGDENVDWTAVKLGDLNGDADPSGLSGNVVRSTYELEVREAYLEPGDHEIVIRVPEGMTPEACQFTLEVDPEIADILEILPMSNDIDYSHLNVAMKSLGLITFSWDNAEEVPTTSLISLRVAVGQATFVSDLVTLTDEITRSLLSVNGVEEGVSLNFVDGDDIAGELELYQNVPNPWGDQTMIKFRLPSEQMATIIILDANGRQLFEKSDVMPQGLNSLIIDKRTITNSGVLYYQLRTEDRVITRKMLVL